LVGRHGFVPPRGTVETKGGHPLNKKPNYLGVGKKKKKRLFWGGGGEQGAYPPNHKDLGQKTKRSVVFLGERIWWVLGR